MEDSQPGAEQVRITFVHHGAAAQLLTSMEQVVPNTFQAIEKSFRPGPILPWFALSPIQLTVLPSLLPGRVAFEEAYRIRKLRVLARPRPVFRQLGRQNPASTASPLRTFQRSRAVMP